MQYLYGLESGRWSDLNLLNWSYINEKLRAAQAHLGPHLQCIT